MGLGLYFNNFFFLRECDGGSKDGANAKHLLLFTRPLRPSGARGLRGGGRAICQTTSPLYAPTAPFGRAAAVEHKAVHFLPLGKKRTKKARGGFAPQPRRAARELSIFPPRGKNVYQHFSSVAKMSFAIEKARREIQRFPSYFGSLLSPFRFSKRFQPYFPIFAM